MGRGQASPLFFCRLQSAAERSGGFLCCLRKESPPDPERNIAFLRLAIDLRPGAAKCRLCFRVVARAPTLDTGDIQGLGPARSVTQRLLGGFAACTLPQQPQPHGNNTGGPKAYLVIRSA